MGLTALSLIQVETLCSLNEVEQGSLIPLGREIWAEKPSVPGKQGWVTRPALLSDAI